MGSHANHELASDSFPRTVLTHCENRADEWAFRVNVVFMMHNVAQTLELDETSPNNLEQDQLQNKIDWVDLRMRTSSRL